MWPAMVLVYTHTLQAAGQMLVLSMNPPSQVKNGGQDSKGFRECHVGAGAKTIYSYQHQLCQQGH